MKTDDKLIKSIGNLRNCYIGMVGGVHTLDKSKIDDLSFMVSIHNVTNAIMSGIITKEGFTEMIQKDELCLEN